VYIFVIYLGCVDSSAIKLCSCSDWFIQCNILN